MKLNTLTDYPHTADLYVVAGQDPDTQEILYTFDRQILCKFITKDYRSLILTEEVIGPLSVVQNIVVTVNGAELQPNSAWKVVGPAPVTNVFGFVEGRSYTLGDTTVIDYSVA